MLSVNVMKGTGRGNYYLNLKREDYYLRTDRALTWHGKGAEAMGLTGEVTAEAFTRALQGETPDGQRTRNFGHKDRVSGVDCTFTVDKHTACIYSQSSPEVQAAIEEEIIAAAKDTFQVLSDKAGFARRGAGGQEREKVELVAAQTLHLTARETDKGVAVNPHVHFVILNVAKTKDGETRTIDCGEVLSWKMAAGALFRATASARLERRLGLEFERDGWKVRAKGPEELSALAEEMSERRKQIEARMEEQGTSSARAAEKAALSTRARKAEPDMAELRSEWLRKGKECGFSEKEAARLLGRASRKDESAELNDAIARAAQRMNRERAVWCERDMLRVAAEEASGRCVDGGQVLCGVQALLRSEEAVRLGPGKRSEVYFTTRENFELEERLLAAVERMRGAAAEMVSPATVRKVVGEHALLSAEQQRAARHLLESRDRVTVLLGMPGTGKSTLLESVRSAYERDGFEVVGAAISARAAKELETSSGIRSHTVARLVGSEELGVRGDLDAEPLAERVGGAVRSALGRTGKGPEKVKLSARSVLVIDEAGMCGTKAVHRLLCEAERAGARVILCGDHRQLQPVGEGGAPLKHLADRLGAATLSTIIRQEDKDDRAAILQHARGQVEAAIRSFARRGKVSVAESRREAIEELLSDWKGAGGLEAPQSLLVLARRKKDVAELNRRCQRLRLEAGELGPGLELGEGSLHVSDRVMCLKNDRYFAVRNGESGTVTRVNPLTRTVTVKMDGSGLKVSLPLSRYEHLSLGYASTTHKAQGATVSRSFVLADEMTTRELSFVQLSRHRKDMRLYLARDQAGEELAEFVKANRRSERKVIAHELLSDNRKEVAR